MSAVSWSAGILPASALADRKIVHMHDFSVTVAAQRTSSFRGLKLRLFAITLPCAIWQHAPLPPPILPASSGHPFES
jgi:hypothetical protein